MLIRFFLFLFSASASFSAFAIGIPNHLTRDDRSEVIKILGMSTSSKILGNPYPLGGYAGLEMGFSLEVINTTDLKGLGSSVESQNEFRMSRITIGKGIFHDIDLFVDFVPFSQASEISQYGGLARWKFFEGKYFPFNLSAAVHANSVNFSDSFTCTTLGGMGLMSFVVENLSLYFGGGYLRSRGSFMSGAGADTVVDPTDPEVNSAFNTVSQVETSIHSFVGLSLSYQNIFAAFQIDRFRDNAYSAKIGIRL